MKWKFRNCYTAAGSRQHEALRCGPSTLLYVNEDHLAARLLSTTANSDAIGWREPAVVKTNKSFFLSVGAIGVSADKLSHMQVCV
jgi:hypothetical protein